ncbi:type II toxin-antitoxin system Phd/YefM family antitoxin [Roseibium sediminis]|uniref:type II toxin-antitoxin system Phd/YefM family antitoxin n=1 Tax=Roseibium sediminis TaxID=1775174 RepID=UPI00123CA58B|nr:type II toxin-antitoxin system Phd/YefM family antitoxin [Roseibium sediminis]
MQKFSISEFRARPGKVLNAVLTEPVVLEEGGADRLVVLPVELYEHLQKVSIATREVYTIHDAPQEHVDSLKRGFRALLEPDA